MCFILQNFPAELLSKFAKIHPFTVLCKVKSCNSRAILLNEVKRGFIAKSTHQSLISNYFLSEEKKNQFSLLQQLHLTWLMGRVCLFLFTAITIWLKLQCKYNLHAASSLIMWLVSCSLISLLFRLITWPHINSLFLIYFSFQRVTQATPDPTETFPHHDLPTTAEVCHGDA